MSIILSSQANISTSDGVNVLGDFGKAIGIEGFPQPPNRDTGAGAVLSQLRSKMNDVFSKLVGNADQESWDQNYVESGKQAMAGGDVQGGKVSPLEEANVRQIYSQSPQVSVIIKKRPFSSLKNLYNPIFMDPAEQWLFRATKRLILNKCAIIADYERLTKITKLEELGAKPGAIIASIVATLTEGNTDSTAFTSAMHLQNAALDRQAPEITTYFIDQDLPLIEEFGVGNGIFEITMISDVNTNLAIDGTGTCSFNIEDPYRILFVTEQDIEQALQATSLSPLVNAVSSAASLALDNAQSQDSLLAKSRKDRGKSEISFTIGVGGTSPIAIIDAIGFEINENNLDDVPEVHALDSNEQSIFILTLNSLDTYQKAMNKNLLNGLSGINAKSIRNDVEYARKKMRLFYLGKSIIQPMDTVHILMDSGTRRLGEGDNVSLDKNRNLATLEGHINVASDIHGINDDAQIDDDLLEMEWRREGQHMRFSDFKKLRTMQVSGEGGIHVFGGLIETVSDRYDASSGKFVLAVNGESNMKWLKISRYNQQPSLDQTQGIVYDPLTPFEYQTDPATGLPVGKPTLSAANQEAGTCKRYFNNGPKIGQELKSTDDMNQDVRRLGGNIVTLYQHAPGLLYKWKDGIQTATYTMSTVDPLDGSLVDGKQLRRDVGFFSSNTPFDNMDAANIISLLVTGFPHDAATFLQAAINNGSFNIDSTLNSNKNYFHTFLDVQRSLNFVHGGFVPFKPLTTSPAALADGVKLQQQLTQKSSRLSQLRTQQARQVDRLSQLKEMKQQNKPLLAELDRKLRSTTADLDKLDDEVFGLSDPRTSTGDNSWFKGGVLEVAGNDISYDLTGGDKNFKLFSDRLTHAALRRRENIINNRDSNLFIVSDEYDKDFDIQSFILKLREQSPDLWKSTWMTVYTLCQQVAEILNFEFFCCSQGHLVFRPPQYNRTPLSVFNQMIALNKTSGIRVFPEFLTSLFKNREDSLTNDIVVLEWEIRLKAALLGKKTLEEVQTLSSSLTAEGDLIFITDQMDKIKKEAAKRSSSQLPRERAALQTLVKSAISSSVANIDIGTFTASGQKALQADFVGEKGIDSKKLTSLSTKANQEAYIAARNAIAKLTGRRPQSFGEFDQQKIGASRNGQSTPASDIARTISDIGELVSRRSKLLKTLEKVLDQNIEIGSISGDGTFKIQTQNFLSTAAFSDSEIFSKLIEDDTKHMLGHRSGSRFIIKDEHIITSTFEEKPPEMTNVVVTGTEPIVGEGGGNLAGVPMYLAYGVDFDMWRQYGWRAEKNFDKPFFWSAEQQCAPYAVMLLSRQRKNIVTGTVTVMGNEFYQLGDVVYITHRQMLYYVNKVSHEFSYTGGLKTTLNLTYGHPIGEYIPTPLDVIGKNISSVGRTQGSYRIKRDRPGSDTLLGVIQFPKDSSTIRFLEGKFATKNYHELVNSSLTARTDMDEKSPSTSSRIYVMSFGEKKELSEARATQIAHWFGNPSSPVAAAGDEGVLGGISSNDITNAKNLTDDPKSYKIPPKLIKTQRVDMCSEKSQLTPAERDLIDKGIVADQKSIALDKTLGSVIEVRLRRPPTGGWKD